MLSGHDSCHGTFVSRDNMWLVQVAVRNRDAGLFILPSRAPSCVTVASLMLIGHIPDQGLASKLQKVPFEPQASHRGGKTTMYLWNSLPQDDIMMLSKEEIWR